MADMKVDMRAKVLIAEDDTIVALDLQGMISRLGYDVVQIVDNASAVLLAAQRFKPDIVLLSMSLPGSSEPVAIAQTIHSDLDLPVIFCVSSMDMSLMLKVKNMSYAGYLLKPINPDSLSSTLDTVLYKYKLEKKVRDIEKKYKDMAEKCVFFQSFIKEYGVFHWFFSSDGILEVDGIPSTDSMSLQVIQNYLQTYISSITPNEYDSSKKLLVSVISSEGDSIPCSLFIFPDPDKKEYRGILVHLDSTSV